MRNKIKILFSLPNSILEGGGLESAVVQLISFLNADKRLYEIVVQDSDVAKCRRWNREFISSTIVVKDIISINPVESKFEFLGKSSFGLAVFVLLAPLIFGISKYLNKKYLDIIKKWRPDIIYLTDLKYAAFYSSFDCIKIGSNHIGPTFRKNLKSFLFGKLILGRFLYRSIDHFHFLPNFDWFPHERNLVTVIPVGVNADLSTIPTLAHTSIRFLYVGRLEEYKGVGSLVEAWQKFHQKYNNSRLTVVGSGSYSRILKGKEYDDLDLLGYIGEDELQKKYEESQVFILPSKKENYSIVIARALMSGLFVIAPPVLVGTYDVFQEMGRLIYPKDYRITTLANSMETAYFRVMNSTKRDIELERRYARERFSIEIARKRFLEMIKNALEDLS